MAEDVRTRSFRSIRPIEEYPAEEIMAAASGDPKSHAVARKDEIERIILSSG